MQKRVKLRWWLLSFYLLFLIVLPVSLYFLSPLLAKKGLEHWLQAQNFSHIELVMQPPTWNTLHIEKLKLQKNQPDKQLSLSTENILLRFNPIELYLHQRLDLIQLPKSDITITYSTSTVQPEEDDELLDLSNLLPEQWFKKIPANLVQVGELNVNLDYPSNTADWRFSGALLFDGEELYSRVKFYRNNKDLGWGDLKLGYDNHFYLRLLENDDPFITIDGALSYTEQLQLDSTQQIEITRLQRWQNEIFPPEPQEQALKQALPGLTGHLETQGRTLFPLRTKLTPDALLGSIQTQQKVKATLSVLKPIAAIAQVDAQLSGTVDFSLSHLAVVMDSASTLSLLNINHASLSNPIKKASIQFKKALNIGLNLANTTKDTPLEPQIDPFNVTIVTTAVALPDIDIAPLTLNLDMQKIALAQGYFKGRAELKNIAIKHQQKQQPLINFTTGFELNNGVLSQTYDLNSTELPLAVSGKTSTQLDSLASQFSWTLKPISLAAINAPLRKYVTLPPELSLKAGTLFHKGTGQFKNNKLSLMADNSIRQAQIGWNETLIEQLDLDSRTTLSTSGTLIDTGNIKLGKVTNGIEITKVSTHYSYTHDRSKRRDLISLNALSAEILGGNITVNDIEFDPLNPEIATQVDIEALDLGEVLKLEQQQGLSGEGKLSGHFPLQYKAGQVSISNGKLLSLAPGGKIIFLPSASVSAYAATNIGLKTAIDALENFHFELLNIQLNYEPDGTALLTTRLKGSNPNWHNGHPIDFTINVEENIPTLMKTLQFTDKLTRTIEKRYR